MRLRKKTTGFTLIELLVVIAIIAILAAILFPVFAKARDKAQTTACLNNVKQIAIATHMYLGDWDNFFPIGTWGRGGSVEPNLVTSLVPYVENNYALFRCSLDIAKPSMDTARPATTTPNDHACSYTFCETMRSAVWGGAGLFDSGDDAHKSLNLDELDAPANFAMVGDTRNPLVLWNGLVIVWTVEQPCSSSATAACFYEVGDNYNEYVHGHGDVRNWAFADGHAKGIKSTMTCTAMWKGPYNNWPRYYCVELDDMYSTVWTDEYKVFTW